MQNRPVSLVTHDKQPLEVAKDYLRRAGFGFSRGPLALEKNLLKGLRQIGQEFNLNPDAKNLFADAAVLRSVSAVKWLLCQNVKQLIVGPNLSAVDMQAVHRSSNRIKFFLAPSIPVEKTYRHFGLPPEKIKVWPVGIDTEVFTDTSGLQKTTDCLLYFKHRKQSELKEVIALLGAEKQTYLLLNYGHYTQADLLDGAKACRYGIILDGPESQGIAVENLMACNLPLLVFDQIYSGTGAADDYLRENLTVTSVPYWSKICGLLIATDMFNASREKYFSISGSGEQFRNFLKQLKTFNPRQYVVENLNLQKQAREFVNLFSL